MIEDKLKKRPIVYNKEKRQLTLQKHGIDLEIIKEKLKKGNDILLIKQNPKPEYSHQFIAIVLYEINGQKYTVVCPFKVNDKNKDIKLITAFPSRQYKHLLP